MARLRLLLIAAALAWSGCGDDSTVSRPLRPSGSGRPAVQIGLERLEAGEGAFMKHERVGLIANAASVTWDGRSALEVLRSQGIHVIRLFAPEHGLDASVGAGTGVSNGSDTASRLKVVSLYGAKTKPTRQDLAGLDALVFDLQDAGVRFYTYISTMSLAEQAAAENRVRFVVLDRPSRSAATGSRAQCPTCPAAS